MKLGDFNTVSFHIYEDPDTLAIYRIHFTTGTRMLYAPMASFVNSMTKGKLLTDLMATSGHPNKIFVNPSTYKALTDEED